MSELTPKEIAEKLRDRADQMLAPLRTDVCMHFHDPELAKIMWIAIRELVEEEINA